ncbi:MAG: DegT/DnrJ/EryC1/StrS family aminotransferase [Planctomycetes bacterium]|nr:DegT/DnrJ/EryC1/StrS family aminotransferase [Planctomycetota bacterium]
MSEKLAINGGSPVINNGEIKNWPPIDEIDRKMVMASLEGGRHAFGPNCIEFEKEFAKWNGNQFAVTTNSGTAALHMSLVACGCGAGDHVLVPAYSWSSSATCILHSNCIPVFVDIDWETMNIDTRKIEAAITPTTRAIVVVHLHGLAVNMDEVLSIAKRHNLKVIEDACQAHGATFKGKKVGTFGDCAAFSFNQNKCLCSGEGGMFVTNNEDNLLKARQLWSFGEIRTPAESRDYHAYALGWMYRNNDMTAAFGRAQLSKLDSYIRQQRDNELNLRKHLEGVPNIMLPAEPANHGHTWYNYTIRFDMKALNHENDAAAFRNKLVKALQAEGVPTSVWQSYPLPTMTVFQARNAYGKGCPWNCQHAVPVKYDPKDYSVAMKHSDWHTGMTLPLRSPNGPELGPKVGAAYMKVMSNLDQVEGITL